MSERKYADFKANDGSVNIEAKTEEGWLNLEIRSDGFRCNLEINPEDADKLRELLGTADHERIDKLRAAMDEAVATWRSVAELSEALGISGAMRAVKAYDANMAAREPMPKSIELCSLVLCNRCGIVYSSQSDEGKLDEVRDRAESYGLDPDAWDFECLLTAPPWPEICPHCKRKRLDGLS